jgi:acyl dehydratase
VDGCDFLAPVYVGDTLTARSTVKIARDSKGQPAFGIVTWHTEGFNQHGALVVQFHRTNLVRKRKPPED